MRHLVFCLLLIGTTACGQSDSTSDETKNVADKASKDISGIVDETVEQALSGDLNSTLVGEEKCAIVEDGVIPELFEVDPALVSYRRSIPVKRVGHVVCSAGWDYPDKAELEAAYTESVQEWGRGMAAGKKEPMPKMPPLVASVSVTLMATQYDSTSAAIADLESSVNSLQEGITVTVSGKDYTTQIDFGDWIDNVGDKAIFSDKGELMVAYNGVRFSVNVAVSGDSDVDRDQSIALAKRLMKSL